MPRHVVTDLGLANEHYRTSLRKGDEGWDVATIQIALNSYSSAAYNLVEDGAFGPLTKSAAINSQTSLGITADGIVGPQTQGAILSSVCKAVETHKTPPGLLKGIAAGESGWIVPTTSAKYGDGSRDYGPFQDHLLNPSPALLREAFAPRAAAVRTAGELIGAYISFAKRQAQMEAWKLAVLDHNWPAAAEAIDEGRAESWTYEEDDTHIIRKLTDPAPWVESYHIPNVRTGLDWTRFYISTKITYVTSWEVS